MSGFSRIAEIDLIPSDYRQERALLRLMRHIGIVTLALALAAAAAGGALRHAAANVRSEVQRLEATAALVNQQRAAVAALAMRRNTLQAELALLEGLRADAALANLLAIIARAAPTDRVWLLEWRVERLGAVVAAAPSGAAQHFVVEVGAPDEHAVRVLMTVLGEARDHAAVAAFVNGLLAARGINDVRIRRASRDQSDGPVAFDLAVVADVGSNRT